MDTDGLFPETAIISSNILDITDRYSKLTRAFQVSKTLTSHITYTFFDHSLILYAIPNYSLTDNNLELFSRFFALINALLFVKPLMTRPYHTQTRDQASFDRNILTCFWHFAKYLKKIGIFLSIRSSMLTARKFISHVSNRKH